MPVSPAGNASVYLDARIVQPLCVYAAGRQSFDVIVRDDRRDPDVAFDYVWSALPLEENGWTPECTVKRAGRSSDGFPIWRFTRSG